MLSTLRIRFTTALFSLALAGVVYAQDAQITSPIVNHGVAVTVVNQTSSTVSGTVTANQGTAGTQAWPVVSTSPIPSGSNTIGAVNQGTPGSVTWVVVDTTSLNQLQIAVSSLSAILANQTNGTQKTGFVGTSTTTFNGIGQPTTSTSTILTVASSSVTTTNPLPTHDTGTVTVNGSVTVVNPYTNATYGLTFPSSGTAIGYVGPNGNLQAPRVDSSSNTLVVVSTINVGGSPVSQSNPIPTHDTGTVTVAGTVTANISGSISNTGFNVNNISTTTSNGIGQPVTSTNTLVQGTQANGATTIPSPVLGGVVASSNIITGVSDTQLSRVLGDLWGRQLIKLNCPRELQVESGIITLTNSTSETLFISSAGTGNYNDLEALFEVNTSTTPAEVKFGSRGGPSGQTASFTTLIPANETRGIVVPMDWPQKTINANWTIQAVTGVSSLKISGLFCKNSS